MRNWNPINVIKLFIVLMYCGYILPTSAKQYHESTYDYYIADTLYVLYEEADMNIINKTSVIKPTKYAYPKDWSRRFNVIIKNHVHIWFYYFNDLPNNSDMIFSYQTVDESFIDDMNLKDQEWFKKSSKDKIIETFSGNNKVIYLIEKSRIKNNRAIMIRVYFNKPTVE